MKENVKELRTLKFEASTIVKGPIGHILMIRDQITEIDLIEGTFSFFRVEVKGLLNPLKLLFKYNDEKYTDLKVIYSRTSPQPDERKNERIVENPKAITIKALDGRIFDHEYIFFRFETKIGCIASTKVIFPN